MNNLLILQNNEYLFIVVFFPINVTSIRWRFVVIIRHKYKTCNYSVSLENISRY